MNVLVGYRRRQAALGRSYCPTRVVYQDVDTAEFGHHLLDDVICGFPFGKIGLDLDAAPSERAHLIGHRIRGHWFAEFCAALQVDIDDRDVGAELCQTQDVSVTQTTRTAGNDRNFTC